MILNRAFAVLLALSIASVALCEPVSVPAVPSRLSVLANAYGSLTSRYSRNPELKTRIGGAAASLGEGSLNQAGHAGQALVMMWILGASEILRKEIEISRAQGRTMNQAEIFSKSGEVAEIILNSGSIWAGFIGAGAAGALIDKPLRVLQHLGEQTATRRILKSLIQSGAATFGIFVGWEAASELFTEATEALQSESDRIRATKLLPVFRNTLLYGFGDASQRSADDSRLLKQIVSHMFKIVLQDAELRSAWLYNTWRNRIATGQFFTLVTAMATSSTVGTTLFPGAGTLAGFMFGVVGGALTLVVPERIQDRTTDGIQGTRVSFWRLGHDGNGVFGNHVASVTELLLKCIPQQIKCPPLLRYNFQPYAREQIVTILSDKIRRYDMRLQVLIGFRNAAIKSSQQKIVENYESEILALKERYQTSLDEIDQVYGGELKQLQSAIVSFQQADALAAANLQTYPQLSDLLERYNRICVVHGLLVELIRDGRRSLESPSEDYLRLVYKFSFYTFKEKEIFANIN